MALRPRRARCSTCRVTHVLLPGTVLPRRADATAVIGTALLASARGTGHRQIAAELHRPAVTVRRWLRAVRGEHLEWLRTAAVERLAVLDRDDPDMLLALLIYAYCLGVRSSRQIEQRCVIDVAFRVLCAQDAPDHTTIARFRAEHQDAFAALFTQVLQVAAAAGLARFGTVAIDGTKIAANASRDANRHYDWLTREVDTMLAQAEQVDAAEDAEQTDEPAGGGQRLPAGLG